MDKRIKITKLPIGMGLGRLEYEEDASHTYNELIDKGLPNDSFIKNEILLRNVTMKMKGYSAVDEGHFILSEDGKSFRMSDETIKKVVNFSENQ